MPSSQRVGVLGGGISGLVFTYYFAKAFPKIHVSLYESSDRLGGWLKSSQINGYLFEEGPRTIRTHGLPAAKVVQLASDLGLESEIVCVSKKDPAAKNRFIFMDSKIHKVPTGLLQLFQTKGTPFSGILSSAFKEAFVPSKPSSETHDESIHEFVARRFGATIASNLVSSVVSGIYAGDSRKLSLKSCFPALSQHEREFGSVVKGMILSPRLQPLFATHEGRNLSNHLKDSVMWTFKNGIETLPRQLVEKISALPNVSILTQTPIQQINFDSSKARLTLPSNRHHHPHHIVSCLPASTLANLIAHSLPSLATLLSQIPFVDVAVVNLAFDPCSLPLRGFGYLTPAHHRGLLLGVVFDSCSFPDRYPRGSTVLTVMLGGFRFGEQGGGGDGGLGFLPEEAVLKDVALKCVGDHLGIVSSPVAIQVSVLKSCIPQYHVGHSQILQAIHNSLATNPHLHSLSLLGSSYQGVSVPDCVSNAVHLVSRFSEDSSGRLIPPKGLFSPS